MDTWTCEQCGGQLFIADLHKEGILKTPIWSHLEDTNCDDPVPMGFVPGRDL